MFPKSLDTADRILQYTAVAANALHDVASATQIPFLDSLCTLSLTIIRIVQAGSQTANPHLFSKRLQVTKFQKDRCLRMMEDIHQLLCALMSLCIHSDSIRAPKTLDQIAQCIL
jgi:hypothetical protein